MMTKIEAAAAVTFKGIERRRLNFRGSSRDSPIIRKMVEP